MPCAPSLNSSLLHLAFLAVRSVSPCLLFALSLCIPCGSRRVAIYYSRRRRTWIAHPLALWTAEDLKRHEIEHGLPHNPLYDMGYERVGCWSCLMLSNPRTNHLQTLHDRHPHLHRALMLKWGAGEMVLRLRAVWMGLPADALLRIWGSVERAYEIRPCWFDGIR